MRVLGNVSKEFWNSVVAKSDHATFFHTYAWANTVTRSFPQCVIETKGFILEDGTRVVLPLVSTTAGKLFMRYISMQPAVYGGPVTDCRALEQQEVDAIFRAIISPRIAAISITGNPLRAFELPHQFEVFEDFTQILDLRDGFDVAYGNWSKGHRWAPRKARREGISVKPADTEAEVLEYFRCYQRNLERWGDSARSSYPMALFMNIFKLPRDKACLWLAFWRGRVVAGSVVFYHSKHAVYWHNAALGEFLDKYPNNLLQYEIIKDASSRGSQFYDFNPSGGRAGTLEGVVTFKSHFGPGKRPIKRWTYVNVAYRFLRNLRRRLRVLC